MRCRHGPQVGSIAMANCHLHRKRASTVISLMAEITKREPKMMMMTVRKRRTGRTMTMATRRAHRTRLRPELIKT